jgi:hypothetical protein
VPLSNLAGIRRRGPGSSDHENVAGRDAGSALAARRRALQVTLGLIWLLDAALQFQPYMFSTAFVRQVILPTAAGNPAFVARPIIWSANLMLGHIVVFNAGFATLQLLLALGLFWWPAVRAALAASIVWSLAVWWLGEGLGGVLTGSDALDPFAGAPGAVVLYVLVALLAWPHRSAAAPAPRAASVAETGPVGALAARVMWAVLWAGLGCAALLPANRSAHGLVAIVFAAACVLAAVTVTLGRFARLRVVAGVVAGLLVWLAQDLGELLTGQATDPNSGLLLIVIAVAFWPVGGGVGSGRLGSGRLGRRLERQRARVDAVPVPGRRGPVVEDVPEVTAAAPADDFRAPHEQAVVRPQFHRLCDGRLVEARPSRARLELRVRCEQLASAACAPVVAVVVVLHVLAGERPLGVGLPEHAILQRGQL